MKDWKEAIITQNSSVRDGLRKIDKAALKIGFVCDEKQKLIGTVSDGDIRRGLLENTELHDPIVTIINRSPKTCCESASKAEMLAIISKFQIDVLPIINDDGVLKNVITFSDLQKPIKRDNPVFIMAGGFGTRLSPLTDSCPKPMLPLGDKPLLDHIIKRFIKQGFWNFYISTHYMPHVITNYFGDGSAYGVSIKYIPEETPLGTGGALSLLPRDISSLPLILINGDVLTDADFEEILSTHLKFNADATMCLREHETSVAYGVVTVEDDAVVGMLEKPIYRHNINTGIYVLSNELISSVGKNEKIDLPTILEQRMAIGKKISAHVFHGKWIDIGQITDFKRAQKEILKIEE